MAAMPMLGAPNFRYTSSLDKVYNLCTIQIKFVVMTTVTVYLS